MVTLFGAALLALSLLPLFVHASVCAAEVVELAAPSEAVVIDGDTIQIGAEVVDLFGIDAPELGQECTSGGFTWTCGMAAGYDLRKRLALGRGPLICEPQAQGPTGTLVAVCSLDTHTLAALQLESGLAVPLPEAPREYRTLAERARAAALGIWHSQFMDPAEWRRARARPEAGCPIRAVITARGSKIYFTPFDGETAVPTELAAISNWCSDDVVRTAGYRRPGEGR